MLENTSRDNALTIDAVSPRIHLNARSHTNLLIKYYALDSRKHINFFFFYKINTNTRSEQFPIGFI